MPYSSFIAIVRWQHTTQCRTHIYFTAMNYFFLFSICIRSRKVYIYTRERNPMNRQRYIVMAKPFTHSRVRSNNNNTKKNDILSDISTKPLYIYYVVRPLYSIYSILRKLYSLSAIRQSKNKEDENKKIGWSCASAMPKGLIFILSCIIV